MIDMTSLQTFLTKTPTGPFVSLYLPREPHQDVAAVHLQLRHLIAHAREVMAGTYPDQDWAPYEEQLAPFFDTPQRLTGNTDQSLGILCDAQHLEAFALAVPVTASAMVTDYPQVLPLLADEQKQYRFDVLVLQRDRIALYHHDGRTLVPTELPEEAPQTLVGTLGAEVRGGELNSVSQGSGGVSYHGHTEKSMEEANDTRRFFQAVDDYIADHYSKPAQHPLVLWGLPQTTAVFREISRNPLLNAIQLDISPANLKPTDLARAASTLVSDFDAQARHDLLSDLDDARSGNRIAETLPEVIAAINARAVVHLLLQADTRVNGQLIEGELDQSSDKSQHNNLLNDLAELAVVQGGRVSFLPPHQLAAPVVALLRYPLT